MPTPSTSSASGAVAAPWPVTQSSTAARGERAATLREFEYWRFCAWNGYVFMGVFIVFWGLMSGNCPPYAADTPAAEIAAYFRTDANWVRAGMVGCMTFAICYVIWAFAIGRVMGKVVGKESVLVDMQVWGAGLTVVPILISCVFWLAGAYRPEALPDEILQLLYDTGWLLIDLAYATTSVQMIAIGVAFLRDERATPLVPRALAWYGIWVAVSFAAECLMPFFKSGAFARHGLLNFWVEFPIWFAWAPLLTYYMLKAIPRLEEEARAEAAHA